MKNKRVYIAGKLNDMAINYLHNVHTMIHSAELIRLFGAAVYVPCLDLIMGIYTGYYTYEDYSENSMAWLEVSDAVFVCPGYETSKGTVKEIARAQELNIPVFFNIKDIKQWIQQ